MKKILCTGVCGFICSNLAEELIEQGYDVSGIDNLSTGHKKNIEGLKLKFYKGDIRNIGFLRKVFNKVKPDYVFHLAALPRIQPSIIDPITSHDNNVNGTLNILKVSKEYLVKKVIYAASSSAYGENKIPYKETMMPNPLNPYAMQKYMGELYCKLFENVYGLKTVCCRFFNVYGPKQTTEGAYATVIGIFLRQKGQGKPMTIVGDGKQTRDFTHVSDIVDGLVKAMESNVRNEVINLGSGRNISIKRITEIIGGDITYIEDRPQEARDTRASISKAKELLGWSPKMTIEKGIDDLNR